MQQRCKQHGEWQRSPLANNTIHNPEFPDVQNPATGRLLFSKRLSCPSSIRRAAKVEQSSYNYATKFIYSKNRHGRSHSQIESRDCCKTILNNIMFFALGEYVKSSIYPSSPIKRNVCCVSTILYFEIRVVICAIQNFSFCAVNTGISLPSWSPELLPVV
ncbi:hypothetical protein NL676_009002 [Syzygium grande]|nr:hypothetical protein NL676_009002 [Syzygium grande]